MTEDNQSSAFQFHGNWQDFSRIAVVNILLTIVTLGLYRFWATTREREYLWSQTQFIDERFEWIGTGKELFVGFLIVLTLFLIPFFVLQFVNQALIIQGRPGLAGLLTLVMLGFIMYLTGLARYRALRYRLARTYWRGIRGGSDDQGFSYGWSYVWKTIGSYLILGLLVPWAMVNLWNERWNKMSFGPYQFFANANYSDCFGRYLLFYLSPIFIFIGGLLVGVMFAGFGDSASGVFWTGFISILIFYFALGLIALAYYAKFFRVVVDGLSLENLDFSFAARTKDWFILYFGDALIWAIAALVTLLPLSLIIGAMGLLSGFEDMLVVTEQNPEASAVLPLLMIAIFIIPFSFVGPFIRYRHWKFYVAHMHAYGEVNLDDLTQSTTERSKHGEGLLDAFDVGAI